MEKWKGAEKRPISRTVLVSSFHLFTLAILGLLLPLSLLLLARLSNAPQLLPFIPHPSLPFTIISFLVDFHPPLLHILISSICLLALLHALTGRDIRPSILVSWTALWVLQFCVGTAVEATIFAGVWPVVAGEGRLTWDQRALFFIGLHETTLFWSRTVVRPLVDDTVYGESREETAAQRVVMGAAFGVVWWWRLKDEVEILGLVVEEKAKVGMAIDVTDFVCLSLYYITLGMGAVRIVKGMVWLLKLCIVRETAQCIDNGDKV
ncbi:hypothetical protein H6P81_002376 [Aristolochia fimbriata]|uniref:Uncharacterized protein n=1 Tax=Aristolochia fimbriata TaxID=158543 RepID=A0AAV7F9U9_ARIFI|nr:hypothetical protein H6P81_002376 [Aristolochia fimbriata]